MAQYDGFKEAAVPRDRQQPTEPGWYWYRLDDQHLWQPMKVFFTTAGLMCRNFTDDGNFVENYPGEWVSTETPTPDPA